MGFGEIDQLVSKALLYKHDTLRLIPQTLYKNVGHGFSFFYNVCTGEMEIGDSLGLSTAGQSGLSGESTW